MKKRLLSILTACLLMAGCQNIMQDENILLRENRTDSYTMENIPEYDGNPYIIINNNEPSFTKEEITDIAYEYYSELDEYGRCGVAEASIGKEIMPTEERGAIGMIKPSGWKIAKYDFIDGKYLYNRCHLIGYQLTGENANERNLITGTRYLNVGEMLIFENMVADYIKETGNHVMYRVTPVFEEDNLLATGVEMEGYSVEDEGEGISFHVFCYNVQPNVEIDYRTGDSRVSQEEKTQLETYIINKNTLKFHNIDCASVREMKAYNQQPFYGKREILIMVGIRPCGQCNP